MAFESTIYLQAVDGIFALDVPWAYEEGAMGANGSIIASIAILLNLKKYI